MVSGLKKHKLVFMTRTQFNILTRITRKTKNGSFCWGSACE
jgi:hypothetical protein